MSITPAQIDLWRTLPKEHQRLEFKEAKIQFDNEKLYRDCVAIANEGGGLILGVADKLVTVKPVACKLDMAVCLTVMS